MKFENSVRRKPHLPMKWGEKSGERKAGLLIILISANFILYDVRRNIYNLNLSFLFTKNIEAVLEDFVLRTNAAPISEGV